MLSAVLGGKGLLTLVSLLFADGIFRLLDGVALPEEHVEYSSRDESRDGDAGVVSDELGVDGDGGEGSVQCVADGGGEEEAGHDEGLHALGGLVICVFQTSDRGENLTDSNQDVRRNLDPYGK